MTIVIDFSKGFSEKEMKKLFDNLPVSPQDKIIMKQQADILEIIERKGEKL